MIKNWELWSLGLLATLFYINGLCGLTIFCISMLVILSVHRSAKEAPPGLVWPFTVCEVGPNFVRAGGMVVGECKPNQRFVIDVNGKQVPMVVTSVSTGGNDRPRWTAQDTRSFREGSWSP